MSGRRGISMVKSHMFLVLFLAGAGSAAAQATRPAAPAAATAQSRHVVINKVALPDAQVGRPRLFVPVSSIGSRSSPPPAR